MNDPPTLSRFEFAARELRARGITVASLPGEYRVNYRNGGDATARMAETLDKARELGRAMAADAPAPAGPAQGTRRRRPRRMTPKAIRCDFCSKTGRFRNTAIVERPAHGRGQSGRVAMWRPPGLSTRRQRASKLWES
jgi:hypothetical protein